jgi:hypothetical protein
MFLADRGIGRSGSFYIRTSLPFRVLGPAFIEIDGKRHRYYVTRSRDDVIVWLDGHTFRLRRAVGTHSDTASDSRAKSAEVRALMPANLCAWQSRSAMWCRKNSRSLR